MLSLCLGSGRASTVGAWTSTTAVQAQDWARPDDVERGGPDADLVVRVGDIDNLGFGWPDGFDPFSGRSTTPHPYPFTPNATDAHNQSLSERRAEAVVAWLTARSIGAGRLQAAGYGEAQPVADNGTAEGRALNRRVEIRDAGR